MRMARCLRWRVIRTIRQNTCRAMPDVSPERKVRRTSRGRRGQGSMAANAAGICEASSRPGSIGMQWVLGLYERGTRRRTGEGPNRWQAGTRKICKRKGEFSYESKRDEEIEEDNGRRPRCVHAAGRIRHSVRVPCGTSRRSELRVRGAWRCYV